MGETEDRDVRLDGDAKINERKVESSEAFAIGDFSAILPLPGSQHNSPKLKARLLRGVVTEY